jgi:hypothetical protein
VQQNIPLVDHFVGDGEHTRRNGETDRHRCLGTLRGCATSVGMLLRPGGHDVLAPRRGVRRPTLSLSAASFWEDAPIGAC